VVVVVVGGGGGGGVGVYGCGRARVGRTAWHSSACLAHGRLFVCLGVSLRITGFWAAGRTLKTAVGHRQVFTQGACVGVAAHPRITNVYAPR